jgi:hypothetical protein
MAQYAMQEENSSPLTAGSLTWHSSDYDDRSKAPSRHLLSYLRKPTPQLPGNRHHTDNPTF